MAVADRFCLSKRGRAILISWVSHCRRIHRTSCVVVFAMLFVFDGEDCVRRPRSLCAARRLSVRDCVDRSRIPFRRVYRRGCYRRALAPSVRRRPLPGTATVIVMFTAVGDVAMTPVDFKGRSPSANRSAVAMANACGNSITRSAPWLRA